MTTRQRSSLRKTQPKAIRRMVTNRIDKALPKNVRAKLKRSQSFRQDINSAVGLSLNELMAADDNKCSIRWLKRTIRGAVVLNVCTWATFLLLFSFYVTNLISDPRGEWELTKQLRSMTVDKGQFEYITSPQDMFDWLEVVLIPALLPEKSSSAIRSTFLHQKTVEGKAIPTINGVLKLLGDRVVVRQIRVANPYDECSRGGCDNLNDYDRTEVISNYSWIYNVNYEKNITDTDIDTTNNETNSGRRLLVPNKSKKSSTTTTNEGNLINDNVNTEQFNCYGPPSDYVKYLTETESNNTKTQSAAYTRYGGGGYIQYLDVSLRSNNGTILASPIANSNIELVNAMSNFDDSLKHSYNCAIQSTKAIQSSGWFDELTRAVFVEYCVAPYFAIVNFTDNLDMTATGRFQVAEDIAAANDKNKLQGSKFERTKRSILRNSIGER